MENSLLNVLKADELLKLKLRGLYEEFGYRKYSMSRFEEYSLYLENRNFLINDAVITFTDLDGRLLALKPDVTLSIVKHMGDTEQSLYYTENVYRPDRAKRSFREIQQIGLERIGKINDSVVGEVVALAARSLKVISEDSLLEISHCGFVDALLNGATDNNFVRSTLKTLIAEKNVHGIVDAATSNGVSETYINALKSLPFLSGDFDEVLSKADSLVSFCCEACGAYEELKKLKAELEKYEGLCDIRLDLSLVGADDYYNGVVFCGYIKGLPFRVLSGGRYDALLKRLGKSKGAVGFAIYFDELEPLFAASPKNNKNCKEA